MTLRNIMVIAIATLGFPSCAMTQEANNKKEIAPEQGNPEKISFDSIYTDDEKLCGRLKNILETELVDFKSETIGKHENFIVWERLELTGKNIPTPPRPADYPISLKWKPRGEDSVYSAQADINNDGIKEQIFKSVLLQGTKRPYNSEYLSIYFTGYPLIDGETVLPNSLHSFYRGKGSVESWVDVIDYGAIPRNISRFRKKTLWIGINSLAVLNTGFPVSDNDYNWLIERNGKILGTLGFTTELNDNVQSHIYIHNNHSYFINFTHSIRLGPPMEVFLTEYQDQNNIRLECYFRNKASKYNFN